MAADGMDDENYPVLDDSACIEWDICVSQCPVKAIRKNDTE